MKKLCAMLPALVLALVLALMPALAEVKSLPTLGLELEVPEDTTNIVVSGLPLPGVYGIAISYANTEVLSPLSRAAQEAMLSEDEAALAAAEEAYDEAMQKHSDNYYLVLGVETERAEEALAETMAALAIELPETREVLGSNSTHTYYLIRFEPADLGEEENALRDAGRRIADALIASLRVIELDASVTTADALAEQLRDIHTVDMDGNAVTAELFARAKLTVLNIWSTTCGPCIGEMPELAAWAKELPEGVQLVGLVKDVRSAEDKGYSAVVKVLEKSGAEFTNLLYDDSLATLVNSIVGTPTTLFLDSNGNAVHEPVVGAKLQDYRDAVKEILG